MEFLDWLVIDSKPEKDFLLEVYSRQILNNKNHKEVAEMCVSLLHQNNVKDQIMFKAIEKISELEEKVTNLELKKERLEKRSCSLIEKIIGQGHNGSRSNSPR